MTSDRKGCIRHRNHLLIKKRKKELSTVLHKNHAGFLGSVSANKLSNMNSLLPYFNL